MLYNSVSIRQVIGRIIRNTRVQDTAYIIDMAEWIPEAMEMMETKQQTIGEFARVPIVFHKGKLPCGLLYIDAVEHRGRRLKYGNSVKNIRRPNVRDNRAHDPTIQSAWISTPFAYPAPNADQGQLYFSTLIKANQLPEHDHHYYEIEYGNILTDFPEGLVTIFYRATPTDEDGMPLIPDNSNYKEALYWYVRGKMIGAGFDDTIVKMQECDQKFEFYAARAIAEIQYPSPDQMETRLATFARLIPKEDYFESYFRIDEKEKYYDPMHRNHDNFFNT
jgi:hypothetical protein